MRDAPVERRFRARDGDIAYWEWSGAPLAPQVVFLHATGFHGRVWDRTIRSLPPHFRALAIDMPGHGRSAPRGALADWDEFTPPITDLIDGVGLNGAIWIGHSMGGYTAALTAIRRPSAVAA